MGFAVTSSPSLQCNFIAAIPIPPLLGTTYHLCLLVYTKRPHVMCDPVDSDSFHTVIGGNSFILCFVGTPSLCDVLDRRSLVEIKVSAPYGDLIHHTPVKHTTTGLLTLYTTKQNKTHILPCCCGQRAAPLYRSPLAPCTSLAALDSVSLV